MINLKQGTYPKFVIEGVQLPLNDADTGKTYTITAVVKLDAAKSQGPAFTFEVQKIGFPELERGTIQGRKNTKLKAQSGVTIIVNGDGS